MLLAKGQVADAIDRYQEAVTSESEFRGCPHRAGDGAGTPGANGGGSRRAREGSRAGETGAMTWPLMTWPLMMWPLW